MTTTIRSVHLPTPLPRGGEAHTKGINGIFGNEEKNSRWGWPAPDGSLVVAGKGSLEMVISRGFVGAQQDRFLVAGKNRVGLFDASLKSIGETGLPCGPAAVDAVAGVWLSADPFGTIAVRRWTDGERAYRVKAAYGRSFSHEILGRHRGGWYVLSLELPIPANPPVPAEYAGVTKIDLGDSDRTDGDGFRLSARQEKVYELQQPKVVGAFHEGRTYLAYADHSLILDADLVPVADLTGSFVPRGMSLDEAGRIYLLVGTNSGNRVWIVTPEGDRILDFELPSGFEPEHVPPVVGYNHKIYLVGGRTVLAVLPDGKLDWKVTFRGEVAAAVVTTDDELLVSAGPELVAVSSRGDKRVLVELAGEVMATAPTALGAGDLAIATQKHQYRLTPKKENAR